jgi:hypothetical protein
MRRHRPLLLLALSLLHTSRSFHTCTYFPLIYPSAMNHPGLSPFRLFDHLFLSSSPLLSLTPSPSPSAFLRCISLGPGNIIQPTDNDPVQITSLTPSAGFTLSDGLVVPSPIILFGGALFLWDVGHPTTATDKIGRGWDGWNEEKLKVFEVMSPRPGASWCLTALAVFPQHESSRVLVLVAHPHRDSPGRDRQDHLLPSSFFQEVPQWPRYPGRCPRLGTPLLLPRITRPR